MQSLFILNDVGEVLIEKHWAGVVDRSVCQHYWTAALKAVTPEEVNPVLTTPNRYLLHVHRERLVFLACTHREVSPLLVIEYLSHVADVFKSYFRELNEDQLRDNFAVVYELLDEMMDSGFPFTTEPNVLEDLIPPPSLVNRMVTAVTGNSTIPGALPSGTVSGVPWRRTTVRYASNEAYFDVEEELNATFDREGRLLRTAVIGMIKANTRLSGFPDMELTFADARIFQACRLHPCVRHRRFAQDRLLSFVPPDGTFKLMAYRATGSSRVPIYVRPQITFGADGGTVSIMTGMKQDASMFIEQLSVCLPLPASTKHADLSANHGTWTFDEVTKICTWDIGRLPTSITPCISGSFSLEPGSPPADESPTLLVDFTVVGWAASGVRIDQLNVLNERYKPYKFVRYVTRTGCCQVRT
eukprot:jgi/Chlat1/6459/Chrsp45S05962